MQAEVRSSGTDEMLQKIRELIGNGSPVTLEQVGFRKNTLTQFGQNKSTTIRIEASYQIKSPSGFALANLSIRGVAGSLSILGLHVEPLPGELKALNAWSFNGKPPLNYLFLVLFVTNPCFIIYALYRCIKSSIRRKWLWAIFVSLGLGGFAVNWTNGAINWRIFYFQLLGVGIMKQGTYAPWIISVGFPLGAILLLRKLRKTGGGVEAITPTPETKPQDTSGVDSALK